MSLQRRSEQVGKLKQQPTGVLLLGAPPFFNPASASAQNFPDGSCLLPFLSVVLSASSLPSCIWLQAQDEIVRLVNLNLFAIKNPPRPCRKSSATLRRGSRARRRVPPSLPAPAPNHQNIHPERRTSSIRDLRAFRQSGGMSCLPSSITRFAGPA